MAVELTTDLGFGPAELGMAFASYFVAMAICSTGLGRLADHWGTTLSLRLGTLGASVAAGAIGAFVVSWYTLVACLILAGTSSALTVPASNRLLVNRVHPGSLGFAFGVQQSAPPMASMLAGLAVPFIALTAGWRWAYGMAAGFGLLVVAAVGKRPTTPMRTQRLVASNQTLRDRPTLVVVGIGVGLAFAASSALLGFYVDAAVRSGTSQRTAALVFAAASLVAISVRLIAGRIVDRTSKSSLRLCGALLIIGAFGLVLLAVERPPVMAAGAVIGFAGAWGFPGVFWYALVRAYPEEPGRITGAMAPSVIGAGIGPIAFGVLVVGGSYAGAWLTAALMSLLAAGTMIYGGRRLEM